MILLTDLIYVQKIRLVGSYVKFIRLNPIFRGYPRNSGRFALVKGRTMFEDLELLCVANILKRLIFITQGTC